MRQEGKERVISLRATSDQVDLDDIGCDNLEAVKLIVDFLYLHNYELK